MRAVRQYADAVLAGDTARIEEVSTKACLSLCIGSFKQKNRQGIMQTVECCRQRNKIIADQLLHSLHWKRIAL